VNELALLFQRLGLDTLSVLEAAGTKWNFLPFRPGLVGGHCIGVDPYYLAHKAEAIGYHPELILAGRRLNDNMGAYVASQVVKLMIKKGHVIAGARVLVLGITFKENCPDIRNTRVVDLVRELQDYGCLLTVHDPHADAAELHSEYGLELLGELAGGTGAAGPAAAADAAPAAAVAHGFGPAATPGDGPAAGTGAAGGTTAGGPGSYSAVIIAVAHDEFRSLNVRSLAGGDAGVVYDLKGILPREDVDGRL